MTNIFFEFDTLKTSKFFTFFNYPAGEVDLRLTSDFLDCFHTALSHGMTEIIFNVKIRSSNDLMLFLALVHTISNEYSKDRSSPNDCYFNVKFNFLYFPYSRADRQFVEGGLIGKDFFMDLLMSCLDIDVINTLDIHSDKYSDNIVSHSPNEYILKSLGDMADDTVTEINVLFPDAGAAQRYELPDTLMVNTSVPFYQKEVKLNKFFATKKRDPETGKLSDFEVPVMNNVPTIIIDDICDGGGTFLGIASKLENIGDLRLYVTHGIFSKGVDVLLEEFSVIYTTDSFYHASEEDKKENVHVYEIKLDTLL